MYAIDIIEQVDASEVLGRFQVISRAASDLTPPHKAIARYMHRRVQERFTGEHDPEGRRWEPLAATTYYSSFHGRRFTKKRGRITKKFARYIANRKILTLSHQLRESITEEANKDGVVQGTNKAYAAIQQLGGKAGRGRKTSIPARPYLGVNDEDRQEFFHIYRDHFGIRS